MSYTVTIPGVYDIATSELDPSPTIVDGDVTISIDGGVFANTTNQPAHRVTGLPLLDLVLTDDEYVDSAIVRFLDQDNEWLGPTVYDVVEVSANADDEKLDAIIAKLAETTDNYNDRDTTNPRIIRIIRGDAYDSVAWPAKSWDVGRDIDGKAFVFTIRDAVDGNILLRSEGVGVGQVAAPAFTSSQSINLPPKTVCSSHPVFDLEIKQDGGTTESQWTPIYGKVEVVGDVTMPGDVAP